MRGYEPSGHNHLSGVVHGPTVQAGSVHGDIQIRTEAPPVRQFLWQLPPAVPLTDRTEELTRLERHRARAAREGHSALAAVSGLGGVGKTALALAWLHTLRCELPDGQLYADLGAQSPGGPVAPSRVLSRFLRGLGVPPRQVPAGTGEQAALYRSLTADRRIVVLLDDAATAAQVRPLLPGGRGVTLVTSRRRMSGLTLEGCLQIHLEPLGPEAAVELLADTLGDDRVAAQPDEARTLAELCGGLPLALRVVGARLAARPRRRITAMVRALTAEQGRLDALAIDGDRSVGAALDLSYQGLSSTAARLYRLLGLHPGTEFGSGVAAAALAGAAGPECGSGTWGAGELLDVLYDANLLVDTGEDRYRFHDLVRLHAAAKAGEEEAPEVRAAVLRRIAEHYLATATRAERIVEPQRSSLGRTAGQGSVAAEDFGDGPEAALNWLERELSTLLAVMRLARTAGLPAVSWQLADAMWPVFPRRKHYDHWRTVYEEGLAAATECADATARCRMLTSGGLGELGRGECDRALEMFDRAARIFAENGDALGRARTLNYRGLALQRLGRLDEAVELFARAAVDLPACGDRRAGGLALLNAADVRLTTGELERAATDADAARTTLLAADDAYNAARAATLLGRIRLRQGMPDEADGRICEALSVLRGVSAGFETARALESLAEVAELREQPALARDRYREALGLYGAAGRPEAAARVRDRLRLLGEEGVAPC